MEVLDIEKLGLTQVNQLLSHPDAAGVYRLINPLGAHALACGLTKPMEVTIEGHTGFYCGGMNDQATIRVNGNVGTGVAENMMSGKVVVKGDASQSAAATAHGGLLVIRGNAAARCAISLKGADVVVCGNVGHMSAFMAQSGRFAILGDAGDALGDSIYEARIYLRGKVSQLGADCIEKPMREEHKRELQDLLRHAEVEADVESFKRYGSARKLYNFNIDNASAY